MTISSFLLLLEISHLVNESVCGCHLTPPPQLLRFQYTYTLCMRRGVNIAAVKQRFFVSPDHISEYWICIHLHLYKL